MTTSVLDTRPAGGLSRLTPLAVIALLIIGVIYAGWSLVNDLGDVHSPSLLPFILLGIALLIALGFEFVNGFHDTANAVATVIYTNSLPPTVAVVWSGLWNFLGVLTSTGLVAFGIISLLPVELILQVGSNAGFAMVFALLIAAIIWNVGTWYFGLPSSSSHTLIGSIIGVGVMNQLMAIPGTGTSGVDWSQALGIGKSLLLSPLIGFAAAALLLLAAKALIKRPELYRAPEGNKPPPLWIRGLLVLTCTGVSFAHGSNDGQKGMGLIMLILIGTVPTAYALNRAMPEAQIAAFAQVSDQAAGVLARYTGDAAAPADARAAVTAYVRDRALAPETVPALVALTQEIDRSVAGRSSLAAVPNEQVGNIRNDMYLASEALKQMAKANTPAFSADDGKVLTQYRGYLDQATKFIPDWVKVAVAIALGLGTMVGWKRIVVTVGEKIGKEHLTYAQGGSAELVAMATIGAADVYGLPVSTTHVLSSGVAGTMAANRSGLQWGTIRNLIMAWVLTLPASIALAAALYWLLRHLF
ncbi:inorganic phosphate transporter [Inquilinus sp. Marseille-Q2685]|uniref:inorganic phosphate transporter n=1 Tax=Inquilinus sp. Marseille-Q2685 TaxID=2866581 RepID=UPI001CE467A4|nr:inorganic phosphate transporter [Inquilinus sp. Marseille-Q2685]